jgi:SAM-dependent methyltransferase
METKDENYKEHLHNKYLPGRDLYLKYVFFPKILNQFSKEMIVDLGFGTGGFLRFLQSKGRSFYGIDSNPFLVDDMKKQGFNVFLDDITKLNTIDFPVVNAVSDNVLEHLTVEQINDVFSVLKSKMAKGGIFVAIVPLEKGYQRDPTHLTFVNKTLINSLCEKYHVKLQDYFFHPLNVNGVGKWFYLNMQVFVLKF